MRTQTKTSVMKLAAVGAVAGLVSGLVKLGWENILPPRTPERDATNPPQTFLQQHGLTAAQTHATILIQTIRFPGSASSYTSASHQASVRFMLSPAIMYRFLNLAMAVCGAWAFGQVPICGQCRH